MGTMGGKMLIVFYAVFIVFTGRPKMKILNLVFKNQIVLKNEITHDIILSIFIWLPMF